jgi:hypothetical protein
MDVDLGPSNRHLASGDELPSTDDEHGNIRPPLRRPLHGQQSYGLLTRTTSASSVLYCSGC